MSAADYAARRIARLFPMMALGLLVGLPAFLFFTALGHSNYTPRDIVISTLSNLIFIPYLNVNEASYGLKSTLGAIFPTDNALWSVFFGMGSLPQKNPAGSNPIWNASWADRQLYRG